jgi:hypothetical protein
MKKANYVNPPFVLQGKITSMPLFSLQLPNRQKKRQCSFATLPENH